LQNNPYNSKSLPNPFLDHRLCPEPHHLPYHTLPCSCRSIQFPGPLPDVKEYSTNLLFFQRLCFPIPSCTFPSCCSLPVDGPLPLLVSPEKWRSLRFFFCLDTKTFSHLNILYCWKVAEPSAYFGSLLLSDSQSGGGSARPALLLGGGLHKVKPGTRLSLSFLRSSLGVRGNRRGFFDVYLVQIAPTPP